MFLTHFGMIAFLYQESKMAWRSELSMMNKHDPEK